jgi:hypothetical protein
MKKINSLGNNAPKEGMNWMWIYAEMWLKRRL